MDRGFKAVPSVRGLSVYHARLTVSEKRSPPAGNDFTALLYNSRKGWFEAGGLMTNEFTAVFERDEQWYIAYCPEIPGANGQGKTKDEARASLADAIALILENRRQDALRGIPPKAELEIVTVK